MNSWLAFSSSGVIEAQDHSIFSRDSCIPPSDPAQQKGHCRVFLSQPTSLASTDLSSPLLPPLSAPATVNQGPSRGLCQDRQPPAWERAAPGPRDPTQAQHRCCCWGLSPCCPHTGSHRQCHGRMPAPTSNASLPPPGPHPGTLSTQNVGSSIEPPPCLVPRGWLKPRVTQTHGKALPLSPREVERDSHRPRAR